MLEVCTAIAENGTEPLLKKELKDYGDMIFEDENYLFVRLDTILKWVQNLSKLWGGIQDDINPLATAGIEAIEI